MFSRCEGTCFVLSTFLLKKKKKIYDYKHLRNLETIIKSVCTMQYARIYLKSIV